MLAYIFWHWRDPHVVKDAYEEHLMAFHEALRTRTSVGFQHSTVFRIETAPWLGTAAQAYEDWYIVDGSAALDPLNEAATSGPCREPHDRVARCVAGGAGGLYQLRTGELDLAGARVAIRFPKPAGMSYQDLDAALRPLTDRSAVSLWRRQMALGPAPEFCWLGPMRQELPARFQGLYIALTRIWSGT